MGEKAIFAWGKPRFDPTFFQRIQMVLDKITEPEWKQRNVARGRDGGDIDRFIQAESARREKRAKG